MLKTERNKTCARRRKSFLASKQRKRIDDRASTLPLPPRQRERAREKKRHIPPVDILAAKASYESAYTGFRDGEASEDKGGKTVGSCDRVEERGGEGREGGREGDHEGVRTCA